MGYKRLTPAHPLHKKVEELHEVLDKLQLTIMCEGDQILIRDNETQVQVQYKDLEQSPGGEITWEIPIPFEWKLILRDDS